MAELKGKRALIVGASSGIGRTIGLALSSAGCRVAFSARRVELLEKAVEEVTEEAIAVSCDVRDEASCEAAVARTVEAFDGLDFLVVATGVAPLRKLEDADFDFWQKVIETNVVGPAVLTRAALPHLRAAGGHAVFFSSISASLTQPWRGLGSYITSKAAVDKMVTAWATEDPEVGFTGIVVGNTLVDRGPVEEDWRQLDPELAEEVKSAWTPRGYRSGEVMYPEQVAEQVVNVLSSSQRVWNLSIVPRGWSTG